MSIKYFSDLKTHFGYVPEVRSISLGNAKGEKPTSLRIIKCDTYLTYHSSTTVDLQKK